MNKSTLLGLTVLSCLSLVVRAKVRSEKKFLSFDFWPRRRFWALAETFDLGGPGGEVGVWWWPWWWMVRHRPKLLQPHAILRILPGAPATFPFYQDQIIVISTYCIGFKSKHPNGRTGLSVRPVLLKAILLKATLFWVGRYSHPSNANTLRVFWPKAPNYQRRQASTVQAPGAEGPADA